MEVLSSETPESVPMDMYLALTEQMAPDEVRDWLYNGVLICCAHMNSCGEDLESMDEVDESFLMYENMILFLIGLCESNGYFTQEELH